MIVSWWDRSLDQTLAWYVGLAALIRFWIASFSASMRWRWRFRPMLFRLLLSW